MQDMISYTRGVRRPVLPPRNTRAEPDYSLHLAEAAAASLEPDVNRAEAVMDHAP